MNTKGSAVDFMTVMASAGAIDAARDGAIESANAELAILEELGSLERFDVRLAIAMLDRSIDRLDVTRAKLGIDSIAASPTDPYIATCDFDGCLQIWETTSWRSLHGPLETAGHDFDIVAFSPDGRRLIAADNDGGVTMWEVDSGKPCGSFVPDDTSRGERSGRILRMPSDLRFSPDGQLLARGENRGHAGVVHVWNTDTKELVAGPLGYQYEFSWNMPEAKVSLTFSPDGRTLLTCCASAVLRWDTTSWERVGEPFPACFHHSPHASASIALSPSGEILASGCPDGSIRLLDPIHGRPIADPLLGHKAPITCIAFNADGTLLASASVDATIRVWDMQTYSPLGSALTGHRNSVGSIAFAHDGKTLFSGGIDGSVRVWDPRFLDSIRDGPQSPPKPSHQHIHWSSTGRYLATKGVDSAIVWNTMTNERACVFPSLESEDARSPDAVERPNEPTETPSPHAVAPDQTSELENLLSVLAREAPPDSERRPPMPLLQAIHGNITATGVSLRGSTIRLADTTTGTPLGPPLEGHAAPLTALKFSPEGRILASASEDGDVRFWDTSEFDADRSPRRDAPLEKPVRPTSLAFSRDGRVLAAANGPHVQLWDVATGRRIGKPLDSSRAHYPSLLFAPNDACLVALGLNGITIWHTSPMRERHRLRAKGGDDQSTQDA